MANNALNISYNASTSPTLYATVRQVATGKVWNAVAGELQTWSDGTLAEYAIPLGSQGGDLYAADMAAGITPGTYRAQFYKQAGNAPALTDTLIGSREFYWNGAGTPWELDDPPAPVLPGDMCLVTIRLKTSSGEPIANATVWVTREPNRIAATPMGGPLVTNDSGEVKLWLAYQQTYYLWARKVGMNPIIAQEFIAEAD